MRQECRERFPRHRLHRKPLVSDPGMHHCKCVTHVPWCMSGSLNCCGEGKCSRHSRRMRNWKFYVSGKRPIVWYFLPERASHNVATRWCLYGYHPHDTHNTTEPFQSHMLLTLWGPSITSAILHKTISNTFWFYSNFTEVCFQWFNWQRSSIGSGSGLAQGRRQAFNWTYYDLVHRRNYAWSNLE